MDFGVRMNPSDMGGERRPALTMVSQPLLKVTVNEKVTDVYYC